MFRSLHAPLCLALLLSCFASAQAATYTTVTDGNWNSPSTWGGSAPSNDISGNTVNINHRVVFPNSLSNLTIGNGTLNVNHILKLLDVNVKMESSGGKINITNGLIISTNDNFENIAGTVTLDNGGIQLCNGGYLVDGGKTLGDGFIFNKAGNIENKQGSGNFSSSIAWCIDSGNGVDLPTSENCAVARPPGGDCEDESHVVPVVPIVLDYGDAPMTYGEAEHIVPTPATVYLGTTGPDGEATSLNSAPADGDDNDSTDDEDAFASLDDLDTSDTSYSLVVPCSGIGTVTGWIDFDQSDNFTNTTPNERASAACSSSSATLEWNSANSNFPASMTLGTTHVRLRIASDATEVADPTGSASDGEVEDYPLDMVCPSLTGDVSEVAPAIPLQLLVGKNIFVGSRAQTPAQGHLKAFAIQADGSISTTVGWDAATLMDTSKRQNKLYSTDSTGTGAITLFNDLDAAAFAAGTPSVATIKSYTLDPSYNSDAFLGTRASGTFLGSLSRGNSLGLIEKSINTSLFLTDTNYRAFYSGTVKTRSEKVLATTDDGFLYAFDQTDGELSWGWMPRSLVTELKDNATFQSNHFMKGKLDVLDVKSGSSYATYIVGAYKNGLSHYVLKLTGSAGLDSVVWDEDSSGSYLNAPNQGEAAYFKDDSGTTWVTYVVSNGSTTSTLVIHDVLSSTKHLVALNFKATSTPFIMPDFSDSSGPASKTLYLGASNGDIRRVALLSSGSIQAVADLKAALETTQTGEELGAAEPVLFLGASISSSDGHYYLRAQSKNRLTVLKYNSSTSQWIKHWASYVGGAGTWDVSGTTFTEDFSGAPTDDDNDGFFTNVTANGLQSLPAGAKITDAAQIVADSLILPISTTASGACLGKAYFYLYRLNDGKFPDNKFFADDGSAIDEDVFVGYGEPTRVVVSDLPGKDQMRGYGGTDQAPDNTTTPPKPFVVKDSVSTGLRGWKELREN